MKYETKNHLENLVAAAKASKKNLSSVLHTLQKYIITQKKMYMADGQNQCLRDLYVVNPQDTIGKIEGTRDKVLDAYKWILSTEEYQKFNTWSDSQSSRVLWLHGPAGTGKTMLFIGIIREMGKMRASSTPFMSYVFCQSDDDKLNNPKALKSLFLSHWGLLTR